jgi:hypothetical protein
MTFTTPFQGGKMKASMPLIVASLILSAYQAQAAQGTAKATMTVVTAVNVAKVSDLIFSEASAGAAAETVIADATETAQNASFAITGEPNKAITVTLPADGTVKMITGVGGGPETEIPVNQFTSNAPAVLDGTGNANLFVGATRDALAANQTAGHYEGNFIVDVVYQ